MRKVLKKDIDYVLQENSSLDKLMVATALHKYTAEEVLYIYGDSDEVINLYNISNCVEASKKIKSFCEEKTEKRKIIFIFGDYDADGVTSSAIMANTIKKLYSDKVEALVQLPERSDGFGLSLHFCEKVLKCEQNSGVDAMIVTTDNGTSAIEAANFCVENNIKLIITDHHMPKENEKIPEQIIVVNPNYHNDVENALCGAGVALRISQCLYRLNDKEYPDDLFYPYAAIGTVADMMDLSKVYNMKIVSKGLKILNSLKSKEDSRLKNFIKVIMAGTDYITASDIGWTIGPVMNSAGRLGQSKYIAAYFNEENSKKRDELSAYYLNELNNKRKKITKEIKKKIDKKNYEMVGDNFIISDIDEGKGMIGVIVNKIIDKINSGIAIAVIEKDEELLSGSIRSTGVIDLQDILKQCEDAGILAGFGGHTNAAGLTIYKSRLEDFKKTVSEYATEHAVKNKDGEKRNNNFLVSKSNLAKANSTRMYECLSCVYPEKAKLLLEDIKLLEVTLSKNNPDNVKIKYTDKTATKSFWVWGLSEVSSIQEVEEIIESKEIVSIECSVDKDITNTYVYRANLEKIRR